MLTHADVCCSELHRQQQQHLTEMDDALQELHEARYLLYLLYLLYWYKLKILIASLVQKYKY